MGWHRAARAHTSPVFGEMEDTIPTVQAAVMTASKRGLSASEAIKIALISNRYTAASNYLNNAKSSYVHKLPTVTQTSPLRDETYITGLAFPDGVPNITGTSFSSPTAMDQIDEVNSPTVTYDASTHSYAYSLSGVWFTKVFSSATYVDDTTYTYTETILDDLDAFVSSSVLVANRTVGPNTQVLRYSYLHLGLTKIKLYSPAMEDTHLFHDIFSTYQNSEDFVAFPIYPLMLDSVYIDHPSRKEEFDDAKHLLKSVSFPIESVFAQMKEGVPTNVGNEEDRITDIFLMNAINIHSPTQAAKAYLFEFFDAIYLNHVDPSTGNVSWNQNNYTVNISESDYNFKLQFNSITSSNVVGSRTDYGSLIVDGEEFDVSLGGYGALNLDIPSGSLTLYAPSASGVNTYRRLVITGLIAHTVIDYPSGVTTSVAINVNSDPDSLDHSNFCIPLILGVVSQLPTLALKEQVFLESYVVVSHSQHEYYLKWYQEVWRAIKKFVIIAISVLIMMFVRGSEITMAAFLSAFLTAVAYSFALEQILAGIDDPFLRAAISLALAYVTGGTDGFSFDTFTLSDPSTLIATVGAVGDAYMGHQAQMIQHESQDFITSSAEQWKDLEEKRSMLEETDFSELMVSTMITSVNTYESPLTFYARTLDTNPGTRVYDQLEYFYDNKIALPKLDPMSGIG